MIQVLFSSAQVVIPLDFLRMDFFSLFDFPKRQNSIAVFDRSMFVIVIEKKRNLNV
jgi:hypothetical protein